jgi:hypothetical protein
MDMVTDIIAAEEGIRHPFTTAEEMLMKERGIGN